MKKIVSKNIMTTNKFQKLDWASKNLQSQRASKTQGLEKIRLDKKKRKTK